MFVSWRVLVVLILVLTKPEINKIGMNSKLTSFDNRVLTQTTVISVSPLKNKLVKS